MMIFIQCQMGAFLVTLRTTVFFSFAYGSKFSFEQKLG